MALKTASRKGAAVTRKPAKRAGKASIRKSPARRKRDVSEHTFERIVPALSLRSFIEGLTAIGNAVPPKIRATIPKDFSQHLDHYLYGTPKES